MRKELLSLSAVMSAAGLINLCNTVLLTALPVYLASASASQESSAFLAAAYSFGFLLGCLYGPRAIARTGHVRAFSAAASLCVIITVAFTWQVSAPSWVILRFVMGIAIGVLFSATDSWINANTGEGNRGRILAFYAIVLSVTVIFSQYLIYAFDDSRLYLAFVLVALFSLAILVLSTTQAMAPAERPELSFDVGRMYARSPSAFLGYWTTGMVSTSALSVMPYYLSKHDVPAAIIALAVSTIYIGRTVLQWPIGHASDRMDRRYVLAALSIASAVLLIIMGMTGPGEGKALSGQLGVVVQWTFFLAFGLWGGLSLPIYSLSVAHALDIVNPEEVVSATSLSLLVFAAGGIAGPLICAALSFLAGDWILPYTIALMSAAYGLFVMQRMKLRDRGDRSSPAVYADVPATSIAASSAVGAAELETAQAGNEDDTTQHA